MDGKKTIEKLLRENIELSKQNVELTQKLIKFNKVKITWLILKIVFIVIPLILSFIYLPPILEGYLEKYDKVIYNKGENSIKSFDNTVIEKY